MQYGTHQFVKLHYHRELQYPLSVRILDHQIVGEEFASDIFLSETMVTQVKSLA